MKILFTGLLFLSSLCVAQIPPGYYNSAAGLGGNALKVALHNIIKIYSPISYNSLWNAYKKTDIKANGKVWDIYSDIPAGTPPYQFSFNTDQCGSYASEGDCYNREHSWPQSWFNSVSGPVSDLFHIYPTDGKVNGMRNNYPYGHVGTTNWTSLNGGKLGLCTDPGFSQIVFEPIDAYKGDLARSYFYMSTRYYSEDSGWTSSTATNKSNILPWEVNVLLQWHHLDPVSAKEIARNDSIYYRFQHNRNPFIDHPEWADSIWQVTVFPTSLEELRNAQLFSVYPNPAEESFQLVNVSGDTKHIRISVSSLNGTIVYEEDHLSEAVLQINCSGWAQGMYLVQIISEHAVSNLKIVKN